MKKEDKKKEKDMRKDASFHTRTRLTRKDTGGANVLRALFRDDLPEDPERIFLTSWGEWWPKDVYGNSLDKGLQDKWCPSQEDLERDEGLAE